MPRSNHPRRRHSKSSRPAEVEPLDADRVLGGMARVESAGDGEWMVREVSAAAAKKTYSCPGCGRSVMPGNPHLVVWREDWIFGEADAIEGRRHWHTACWRGRSFRTR
ncbi:hypothetical protein [Psychromicrobium lacuslunae]|uniref:ATP/GTP-binding protein n=1 Tax=Psychromicrobium lacuslunae TaxID=1618207 RepID=A0A0D4BXZ8_9MICC|nr:hypothetical protein [Psychromicrobium lacuslunae]AJT41337.1 hypothetical protein UM93_07095 [Psychromicrobium lacuslunae]